MQPDDERPADPDAPAPDRADPDDPDARKHAEALRRDREKAERAAQKEAARAEKDRERARKDAEKAQRDRDRAARAAEKEAERLRAEQERAVREVEREADRAEREAQRAALDARLAAQRAARQVERARLRALAAREPGEEEGADLPPGLAVLWRPAPVGRRGPRPGLTVAGIAEAAIALADADGLGAVSMARVAERLGVTTMALYRYVSSKDDLLAVMLDAALAEAVTPAGEPAAGEPGAGDAAGAVAPDGVPAWRAALERWCADQLDLARRHPWAVQTPAAAALPGPARVAFLERGLRALDGTPLSWSERTAVVGRLSLHLLAEGQVVAAEAQTERAYAAAAQEADGGAPGPAAHPALVDYASLLRAVVDPQEHPVLAQALDAGAFDADSVAEDDEGRPDWGLRLVLDGVAAVVARAEAREAARAAGPG